MSGNENLRMEIVKYGGVEAISELILSGNDQKLILVGLQCLAHYATDSSFLLSFNQVGGLDAICSIVASNIAQTQYQALRFIRAFINESALNMEAIRLSGFIPHCVNLLESPQIGVMRVAVKVLFDLSLDSRCAEDIAAFDGVVKLLPFINHEETELRVDAISLIAAITVNNGNLDEMYNGM